MKRLRIALFILCFVLSGCGQKEPSDEQENVKPIVTFQMVPSSNGVEDYIEPIDNYSEESYGRFYNVVPEDISNAYGVSIFKSDLTCASILAYDDKYYPLDRSFGGFGVTSFAITDLNEDGEFELYFTFSYGSGIPRSQVGYFDAASRETEIFDLENWWGESLLGEDKDHVLCVYNVDWETDCNIKSFVDIEMSAGDKIASIVVDNGKISLIQETDWKQ
ncbi:MAG: hypothetical protein K2H45_08910 [Acetatifactor sp.]|nr:hypothetical protein [Acetatifactor sp.]